jgi:hypothetical protein
MSPIKIYRKITYMRMSITHFINENIFYSHSPQ